MCDVDSVLSLGFQTHSAEIERPWLRLLQLVLLPWPGMVACCFQFAYSKQEVPATASNQIWRFGFELNLPVLGLPFTAEEGLQLLPAPS